MLTQHFVNCNPQRQCGLYHLQHIICPCADIQKHKLSSKTARKTQSRAARGILRKMLCILVFIQLKLHVCTKQPWSIFHWVKLWAYFCTVSLFLLVVSCSYLYTENAHGNSCFLCSGTKQRVNLFRLSNISALTHARVISLFSKFSTTN